MEGNDDEKKDKEIDDKRVHQIADIMNKKKKYNEGDIEIKPAYKQSKKKKGNNPSGKDKLMDEDEEKSWIEKLNPVKIVNQKKIMN